MTFETWDMDPGVAKFDLLLNIEDRGDRLRGSLEYSRDLFEAESGERMVGHYLRLLEAVVVGPGRRLGELELLGEAWRRGRWRGAWAAGWGPRWRRGGRRWR